VTIDPHPHLQFLEGNVGTWGSIPIELARSSVEYSQMGAILGIGVLKYDSRRVFHESRKQGRFVRDETTQVVCHLPKIHQCVIRFQSNPIGDIANMQVLISYVG